MQINYIHIKNYRGIKNAHFNLSPMGCLIGENNAGKSSILLAISLFFSGSRINLAEYYDTKEEISIEIHFGNINAGDINRLKEEHRERINEIITNGNLKLVRKYYSDGSGDFLCKRWIPQNHNLRKEIYTPLLTGKKGKEIEATLS
ncbi:MAG: AAA family ATPase, partial [Bacteroidetes bacterium]|nr:AAA family ATPase [Bacteroidota bacterium]